MKMSDLIGRTYIVPEAPIFQPSQQDDKLIICFEPGTSRQEKKKLSEVIIRERDAITERIRRAEVSA